MGKRNFNIGEQKCIESRVRELNYYNEDYKWQDIDCMLYILIKINKMKTRKIIALILLAIFVSSCASQQCWNTKNNKNNKLYK